MFNSNCLLLVCKIVMDLHILAYSQLLIIGNFFNDLKFSSCIIFSCQSFFSVYIPYSSLILLPQLLHPKYSVQQKKQDQIHCPVPDLVRIL